MRGRREVCSPCTSSWIFTPCSRANAPHSASALPICSSVRSSGTSLGRPFGRTFTLGDPMSCANFTHAFVSSTFFRTRAGSAEWYSHVVPRPPILTGESDLDRRVREAGPYLRSRGGRKRKLDAVPMGRSQLHCVKAGLRQVLDEHRHVPVLRDVVGDGTEVQRSGGGWLRRPISVSGGQCRHKGHAREEIATMHARSLTHVSLQAFASPGGKLEGWTGRLGRDHQQLPAAGCRSQRHERIFRVGAALG